MLAGGPDSAAAQPAPAGAEPAPAEAVDPTPAGAAPAPAEAADPTPAGAEPAAAPQPAASASAAGTLPGARPGLHGVPAAAEEDETVARMLAELSTQVGPPLPVGAARLVQRWGRVGLAVGGGLAVITALLLALGLVGLFL